MSDPNQDPAQDATPATTATTDATTGTPVHDELVEEVSIDGMCGVY